MSEIVRLFDYGLAGIVIYFVLHRLENKLDALNDTLISLRDVIRSNSVSFLSSLFDGKGGQAALDHVRKSLLSTRPQLVGGAGTEGVFTFL